MLEPAGNLPHSNDNDVIWGAAAIGKEIGLNARQAFDALSKGHLPGRKVGRRWCSVRRELRARVSGGREVA